MDKFLLDLQSPYFWLAVVVVGILINLASGLVGTGISAVTRYSVTQWRLRSKANEASRLATQLKIINDPEFRAFLRHQEMAYRTRSTHGILMAILALVLLLVVAQRIQVELPSLIYQVFAFLSSMQVIFSISDYVRATNIGRSLTEAEQARDLV